jgi:hypothetical protein
MHVCVVEDSTCHGDLATGIFASMSYTIPMLSIYINKIVFICKILKCRRL